MRTADLPPQRQSMTPWQPEEIAYLRKRHKQGAHDAEIAREMGTTMPSVRKARQKLKIRIRGDSPWTDTRDQMLIEMRADGYAWVEIAAVIGIPPDNCRGRHGRLCGPPEKRLKRASPAPAALEQDALPARYSLREQHEALIARELREQNRIHAKHHALELKRKAPPAAWCPGDPVTW